MARAKLRSALVMCNVPSTKMDDARRFYSVLLGSDEFARAPNKDVKSYFRPISDDGIDLNITQRFDDRERLTCYFAVDNLNEMLQELKEAGGTVVADPRDVRISGSKRALEQYRKEAEKEGLKASDRVGRMAVILDPDGNHVGLIQLDEAAQRHFRVGRFQRSLGEDLVRGHDEALKTVEVED